MKKETFKIHGIHCASCVATIEQALKKAGGVHSVSVNFASESALIEFDENTVSEQDLAKAVGSVGYHLEINSPQKGEIKKGEAVEIQDMKIKSHGHTIHKWKGRTR